MDLAGKHVVITGGSRGIGAAMAGAFAAADARVSLVARDERLLRQVAERVGAAWLVADVTDPGGLIERAQRTAPIDILINNAGLDHTGAFTELSAQRLGELYAVNALAPAELSRQVLPTMLSRGSGQIVFISSLSATVSLPGLTAYSASKAAVSQLVPGLRAELRGSGVQIILAEIGPVVTGMYDAVRSHPTAARALDRLLATRTLRLLNESEVAAAIVDACRRQRRNIVLPRRARPQTGLTRLPQRVANLLTHSLR
jgi:short-subunit dehydrogenase